MISHSFLFVHTAQDSISSIKKLTKIRFIFCSDTTKTPKQDKLIDFIPNSNVENIIFLPDSGVRIKEALDDLNTSKNMILVKDLEEAVNLSNNITKSGGVLLSPAAASYGVYKNFEERGNHFKECFNNLK